MQGAVQRPVPVHLVQVHDRHVDDRLAQEPRPHLGELPRDVAQVEGEGALDGARPGACPGALRGSVGGVRRDIPQEEIPGIITMLDVLEKQDLGLDWPVLAVVTALGIGGLAVATALTLIVIPVVYSLLAGERHVTLRAQAVVLATGVKPRKLQMPGIERAHSYVDVLTGAAEIGERVFNMERLYNLREGLTDRDDTLPRRLLEESIFPDVDRGVPLDKMLPDDLLKERMQAFHQPFPEIL